MSLNPKIFIKALFESQILRVEHYSVSVADEVATERRLFFYLRGERFGSLIDHRDWLQSRELLVTETLPQSNAFMQSDRNPAYILRFPRVQKSRRNRRAARHSKCHFASSLIQRFIYCPVKSSESMKRSGRRKIKLLAINEYSVGG